MCHHLLCQESLTCLMERERVIVDFGDTREGSKHRGQKQQDALKAELRPEVSASLKDWQEGGSRCWGSPCSSGENGVGLGFLSPPLSHSVASSCLPWPAQL